MNFTIRISISPLMPTILTDMHLTGDQAGFCRIVQHRIQSDPQRGCFVYDPGRLSGGRRGNTRHDRYVK